MSFLDENDYKPRYTPPKGKKYRSPYDSLSEEKKLSELNNMDREGVTEDFGDSPHADRQ